MSSKITSALGISNFIISERELVQILGCYREKEVIYIGYSKLKLGKVPSFGTSLDGARIKTLSLNYCGSTDLSDWKKNYIQFENLITGLSESPDFVANLKEISLLHCGLGAKQVKKVLGKNGFEGVKVKV